ncbi:YkgJ family cysteine cluster protein, partial [Staphylococcus aureus]
PDEFTEPLTPFLSCMKGTNEKQPRCEKLIGEVGECVSCAIYEQRPSPCREFEQSWANGVKNEACDRARAAFGLPPLPNISLPHSA